MTLLLSHDYCLTGILHAFDTPGPLFVIPAFEPLIASYSFSDYYRKLIVVDGSIFVWIAAFPKKQGHRLV